MTRFLRHLLAFTILLTGTVFANAQHVELYKIQVGQFSKLKIDDNVNVVYRNVPDSTGWVQYAGDRRFADAFILSCDKETLKVQVSTEDVNDPELPTLYIYSDFLTYVENSSTFEVRIETPAPCPAFEAKLIGNGVISVDGIKSTKVTAKITTGNGTINLSGECHEASYQMLGTGTIQADRLKADEVKCKILGSGTIGCWATESLKVRGIGSTKIYYKGEPEIRKSGGGHVYRLPTE